MIIKLNFAYFSKTNYFIMKPQLLKVSKDFVSSFSARKDTMPDVNNRLHYLSI